MATAAAATNDPIATLLFERFDRIPMPNLRLGDAEVSALMAYMEEETTRLQTPLADTAKP